MSDNNYVKTITPNVTISKSDDEKDDTWYISGYASTDAVDTDGEQIEPEGIDYSWFKDNGWITYEHLHNPASIIGEPLEDGIQTDGHGLHLKGFLYKGSEKAQEIWNLSKELQKEPLSNRSMAFSVEGQVKDRDPVNPNIITAMNLTAVTVTTHPANPEARWQPVAKSMEGYEIDPNAMEDISALRRESLVGTNREVANAITTLTYVLNKKDSNDILGEAERLMRTNGTLSKNDLSIILQLSKGISRDEAMDFVNKIVRGV